MLENLYYMFKFDMYQFGKFFGDKFVIFIWLFFVQQFIFRFMFKQVDVNMVLEDFWLKVDEEMLGLFLIIFYIQVCKFIFLLFGLSSMWSFVKCMRFQKIGLKEGL